jgi:23S rRNA pseudouridine1911/1915/1917 synthase
MTSEILLLSGQEMGMRLDKLLKEHYPLHSRTYFQYLIENGYVLVNGRVLKKREKPKEGDEIEICFVLTPELSLAPEEIPLDILYEDEHLLAINKPAGMVVHPAPGHPSNTFVNALLFHCKNLPVSADDVRPGIVHRLDKDTSGVLIAAKTSIAHAKLVELFSSRQIEKNYLAVCVGNPGNTTINAPLKRHPIHRKEMTVCPEGKEAISRCTVLAVKEQLALVDVQLITGRTHQIRAHLKSKGTPVVGDPVYGSPSANQKYGIQRQLLHAHRVAFTHPLTQKPLILTAPLPSDLAQFLKKYQLD